MAGSNEMTVIGRDTKIKGEMQFEGGARILGTFEGKITAAGEVQVGAGAFCNAAVEAERVVVDGNINGDITASDVLTLNADAKVEGDIVANKLVVIEGATFVGNCRVGPTKGVARPATPATPARASGNGLASLSPASTPSAPAAKPEPTIETRVGSLHTVEAA